MSFSSEFVRVSGGAISFYSEITTTNLYVETVFGSNMNTITVTNDSSTDPIQLSYDGATLEAEVKPGESLTMNSHSRSSVRVKGTAGGDKVRLWGW